MNVNERKGKVYDKLEKAKEILNEELVEAVNDVKGLVPEEWEDTMRYISSMERHMKKVADNIEFASSSLDNKH